MNNPDIFPKLPPIQNNSFSATETLAGLPNIGPHLENLLVQAGFSTPRELRSVGSKEAFLRIRKIDPAACLSSLNALEGAVVGIRWHNLPAATRSELKVFFNSL